MRVTGFAAPTQLEAFVQEGRGAGQLFVPSVRLRVPVQDPTTKGGFLWSFALAPVFVLSVWGRSVERSL